MEAIPETQGDTSGLNPSSVKSEDSSPQHDNGRGSPPPNCAICLGTCRNKSFTDSCLHQFCFKCLLTWSKVKAECPLCKQNFKSIIHNVRSNHQYEEYRVGQQDTTDRIDIDTLTSPRRFRYRTTLTLPRRETIAIEQLLLHYPLVADVLPPPRRRRSPASFRRTVYRHNLWARPLPDFTGRFRDCTPEFYRYNDTQMHRLVPWLNRELYYLLHENVGHISYVMTRILELLPQYHITSPEFRDAMQRYFGVRTEHFLHELYCFASTPYDMTGYDRNVQYTTDSRISTMVNEVISSSDSEASVDSDIVMVSSSEPANASAGPSGVSMPPLRLSDTIIPIETISQSDTDDDSSEVMVVGYIKPPEQRTPEVVDLLGSDSDVVEQDATQTEPSQNEENECRPVPLVKLTLKRQRSVGSRGSDSDESSYRRTMCRRRRQRSGESATTVDTRRDTPSTSSSSTGTYMTLTPVSSSTTTTSSTSTSSLNSPFSSSTSSSSDSDSSSTDSRRKRSSKNKSKSKRRKASSVKSDRKKSTSRGKRSRRQLTKEPPVSQADSERRSKRKSHSGKGVKSSKRKDESPREVPSDRAGPSTSSSRDRRKPTRDRNSNHDRENRRLRSVVNVPSSNRSVGEPSSSNSASSSRNNAECSSTSTNSYNDRGKKGYGLRRNSFSGVGTGTGSDPEDDLPLNLTVKKSHPT